MDKEDHEAALLKSYQEAVSLNGRKNPNSLSKTEQVLSTLGITLVLIGISALLFYKGTFLFGSLLSMFTYGYFVYGCFITQPEVVTPYAYRSGSSWNAAQSVQATIVKQQNRQRRISQSKGAASSQSFQSLSDDYEAEGAEINNIFDSSDPTVNPSNGLPMIGSVDIEGNPMGCGD
ncbi:hypothetical protein GMES_1204 [Paraglaciecola mesophila KMM 241]|uniref:Uncharacterized protein n=1 Tax=Paraglaciecola mesophila KMM 241 TaxID=1128912 RepID=K6Z3C6_9ALTE|nr:hypothetical protein [Paraglaciecola mesophila]GAC23503.1 hypothetical protein GMES_1204 [Paraglaciecola mesophila KMM 241]